LSDGDVVVVKDTQESNIDDDLLEPIINRKSSKYARLSDAPILPDIDTAEHVALTVTTTKKKSIKQSDERHNAYVCISLRTHLDVFVACMGKGRVVVVVNVLLVGGGLADVGGWCRSSGEFVKSAVFGGLDGIMTSFAVIARYQQHIPAPIPYPTPSNPPHTPPACIDVHTYRQTDR
jgi:hypothetical protein